MSLSLSLMVLDECLDEECGDLRSKILSGLLSPRVLGCRAEDAAADAHREVLADKFLELGAVLAREQVEGRHPIRHGTVDVRAALEQQVGHRDAASASA